MYLPFWAGVAPQFSILSGLIISRSDEDMPRWDGMGCSSVFVCVAQHKGMLHQSSLSCGPTSGFALAPEPYSPRCKGPKSFIGRFTDSAYLRKLYILHSTLVVQSFSYHDPIPISRRISFRTRHSGEFPSLTLTREKSGIEKQV